MLKCKFCSQKDATDSRTGVSTIEVSNIVLKSLKKKCDAMFHNGTGQDVHASDENIMFPPSKERYVIMTYRYPLDELLSESNFS